MIKDGINLMWEEVKKAVNIKDVPYRYNYRFSDNDYHRVLWYESQRWEGYPQWSHRTEIFKNHLTLLHRAYWRTIVC